MSDWQRQVQETYDRVAAEYAARIFGELAGKPFDRAILDRFAERAAALGPLCDLGCGPGHVARYLHHALHKRGQERGQQHETGVEVVGVDLSPGMIAEARRLSPDLRFEQGTMLALDFADGQLGGVVAYYSIVNVPRDEQPGAFAEILRVLAPCGLLLVAFHVGSEDVHLEEWWETPVSIDFFFYDPGEIVGRLEAAGFVVEETHVREPYPGVEHPSRRAYVLAHKPGR